MMNSKSHLFTTGAAFLALSFAAACGGSSGTGPAAVNLRTAANYAILAETGITSDPTNAADNHIIGNIGVSSTYASITDFALTPAVPDVATVSATSAQVSGNVYAFDYHGSTPSDLTTAVNDMMTAYADAAGRAPDVTELASGNIGGKSLAAGVYKWGTGVAIRTAEGDLTLHGGSSDTWIFQIAGTLTMNSARKVILTGGALPKNVFWQVAGAVALDANAQLKGVVLAQTGIALGQGASVDGRLLAQTNVTLIGNTVTEPAP